RFHNEARAAASLRHPNIVQVHFVGCERAVHFYAMDYIEGKTLAELIHHLRRLEGLECDAPENGGKGISDLADNLSSGGFVPANGNVDLESPTVAYAPDQPSCPTAKTKRTPQAAISTERSTKSPAYFRSIAEIGVQVAEALDHAHEFGVIHRDVKPSNLILDHSGKPWVTDFGLARIENDATLTVSGDLLGTVRYMSPEQTLGKRVGIDHRTDIYSLGATLYELLTLRPVCNGETRQEVLRQIAFEDHILPRKLNRSVPRELETILLKAMAKNPAERYGTAKQLADDLRRFIDDKPVLAQRPSVTVRITKWVRRHRSAAISIAIAVLLGFASAATLFALDYTHKMGIRDSVMTAFTVSLEEIADRKYESAVGRLEVARDQAHTCPAVWLEIETPLEKALQQACDALKCQRFLEMADSARFDANRFDFAGYHPDKNAAEGRLGRAKEQCDAALSVYDVISMPDVSWDSIESSIPASQRENVRLHIVEVLILLARVEEALGNDTAHVQRAVSLLQKAERISPHFREVYAVRAKYWEQLGNKASAKADMQRADNMQPAGWIDHFFAAKRLIAETDYEEAARLLEKALTYRVDDYWTWYFWGYANKRFGEGQPDNQRWHRWAMRICLGLRPEETTALLFLGEVLDNEQDALQAFCDVTERTSDPDIVAHAHCGIASIHYRAGRFEAAMAEINRSVELIPEGSWYRIERARIYLAQGEQQLARADAQYVITVLEDGMDYWHSLHRLAAKKLLNDWEGVAAEARRLIELERTSRRRVEHYLTLAEASRRTKQFDAAIKALRNAGSISDSHSISEQQNALARDLLGAGDVNRRVDEALELAREAVSADPSGSQFEQTLAIASFYAGQFELAKAAITKSIALRATGAKPLDQLLLALCHQREGQTQVGHALYKDALACRDKTDAEFEDLWREAQECFGE
ncbi:MAG: hypothetical protein FJ276_29645, partial [Planctomycetes bacterium]|nr:hypothetical protein [Planctomycetota bacterium]